MPSESIVEQAKKIVEKREEVSKYKAVYEEANAALHDMEMNLYQAMDIEEVKNFKLDGIGTFYTYSKPWARITNWDKAVAYLKTLGVYDEVIQPKPVSARLNATMKENFIEKGEPVPEDAIGIAVELKPSIGLRRG